GVIGAALGIHHPAVHLHVVGDGRKLPIDGDPERWTGAEHPIGLLRGGGGGEREERQSRGSRRREAGSYSLFLFHRPLRGSSSGGRVAEIGCPLPERRSRSAGRR